MSGSGDPIRVLLVDDSAVIRAFVTATLEEEHDIVIAATASNGQIALERLDKTAVDVVVLDVEMPVLDGLSTLAKLRPAYRDLPVIMYSTLTQRGATATLDALSLGATDYVLKPSHLGDAHAASDNVKRELAPVIRSWGGLYRAKHAHSASAPPRAAAPPAGRAAAPGAPAPVAPRPFRGSVRPEAVVIGSSTGGPQALTDVIPLLPATLGVPVLLVQHMPPLFTRLLAERLEAASSLDVVEAEPGMRVRAGTVYVAPGGSHMVVRREGTAIEIALDDGPPENSCKPAVDVLFRSAVKLWGPNLAAVILTGMGQDGLEGCRAIAAAGGPIIAQDEATSVVWGMPGAVSRAGIANEILPIKDIAPAIARIVAQQRTRVSA